MMKDYLIDNFFMFIYKIIKLYKKIKLYQRKCKKIFIFSDHLMNWFLIIASYNQFNFYQNSLKLL